MSKLPVVTGKDLVKVLGKNGWDIHHIRGSHHQLRHRETGKKITIAVHAGKELKRGMLSAILKEIGMTPEKLQSLL